jgi:hypothetical protein
VLAWSAAAAAGLSAGGLAMAQDDGDGIPGPVTTADFSHLFQDPPFRRLLSLSEALVLSGVAELPGGALVTVYNRVTNETFVVGEQPNPQGWRLLALESSPDISKVLVRIEAGGQEIVLRFSPERLEPPARRRGSATLPGRRDEALVVVEAFLRTLDPEAAGFFELLAPRSQEDFRESFATYLKTYPEASDADKVGYARRQLQQLTAGDGPQAPPEVGAAADGQPVEAGGGASETNIPSNPEADTAPPAPAPAPEPGDTPAPDG